MKRRYIFERLQRIDEELRQERYPNCRTLAASMELSQKSLQRDIAYMRDVLGAPIEYDARKQGYYYGDDWMFFPNRHFDEQDTRAILAAKSVLSQHSAEPYYDGIRTTLDKVLSNLKGSRSGQHMLDVCSFGGVSRGVAAGELFTQLERAIRERLRVRIVYVSLRTGKRSERIVRPCRLHLSRDEWHLIAWCELRKGPHSFLLQGIERLEVTERPFRTEPSFDVDRYIEERMSLFIRGGKHTVRIRFSPRFADYIRSQRWHPDQEISVGKDGSLVLSMQTDAYDIVACWVMQFGTGAEVLGPAALRRRVVREADSIARLYGNGKGGTPENGKEGAA